MVRKPKYTMKNSLILLLLFLSMSLGALAQNSHKIVFQLATADEKEQSSLTRQLNNVLNYWPKAEIEVVVHSGAIEFMMSEKSIAAKEIPELMKRGVQFAVCQNTMKRKGVTEEQIISGAKYVPVGIAEIVIKQEEGFEYIKAGY